MEHTDITPLYQIQPCFTEREKWEAAALQEGLFYEVLELSSLPVLGDNRLTQMRGEWYRSGGRTRSLHGAFIDVNPASGDAQFRTLSRRRCMESCRLARELGAENVVFHSSCSSFLRGAYMETWAQACAEYYGELAQETGLHIWIENSQDVDPVPLKELMRRITNPDIGVCLDLGHANYSNAPLEQWFDELGEWIGYMHLSDNTGLADDHLPIGQGNVDWKAVDSFWRTAGRRMPMTLETGGLSGVRSSLRYLKRNGYFGCSEE